MRIAVFSDTHGNPFATQAVLAAIASDGAFDAVVAAGDLCFGGSDPARSLDLIRAAGTVAVYGNTDKFIYAPDVVPPDEMHRSQWEHIRPDAVWAAERLGAERVAWLQQLPFQLDFQLTQQPADRLRVVHANPLNVEFVLLPPPSQQQELYGEIRQPDDDRGLVEVMAATDAGVLAFGHLHFTSQRKWRDRLLVNVAPCSMPAVDGDARARYTIFTWRGSGWGIERKLVEYDSQQEIDALIACDLPGREGFAQMMGRGG